MTAAILKYHPPTVRALLSMLRHDRREIVMNNVIGDLIWLFQKNLFGGDYEIPSCTEIYKKMINRAPADKRSGEEIVNDILNKYGGESDGG